VQLAVFGNPPRGLESITVGHLDVHQHDVIQAVVLAYESGLVTPGA